MDENRTVNIAIQVVPLVDDAYAVVDRAIRVIMDSGLKYEVGPMETTIEGPFDAAWAVAREAHLECVRAGAGQVLSYIKVYDGTHGASDSMGERTSQYR